MFNLLRSSRHRKKPTDDGRKSPQPTTNAQQQSATYDWHEHVPATASATATSYRAALARAATKTTTDRDTYTERYRLFSESRNEAPTTETATATATATRTTPITATRACIEELEDLHEFDVDNDVAVGTDDVDLDEKVNLAKSTAAAPPPRTKNSKTNSAINAKDNVYTVADGKINEFIATTGALKAGRDSQNEPTEWQGRNFENDRNEQNDQQRQNNRNDHSDFINGVRAIDTKVIDKFHRLSDTKYTVDQQPNRRDTTSLAESARATLQFDIERSSDRGRDCIALISSEQKQQQQKNSQNSPQEQVTVVPPVRYRRHLDRTPDRSDQQTEQKRQSRLSLTLGLGSGKSSKNKTANDTAGTTNKVVVDNRSEFKRSDDTAATQPLRRSFFRSGKAKSVERDKCNATATSATVTTTSALLHEDEELKRPNSKLFYKGNNKAPKSVATSGTTRALQRSKEFLSDIFMARGRNHNRNRNFTTTQQQQQTAASPQSKSKVHIVLHSPVSTSTVKVKPTTTTNSVEKIVDIENKNYQNHNNNNSGESSNSNCNINKRHDYVTDWTHHSTTHLETISDPSSTSTTTTTTTTTTTAAGAAAATTNNNKNTSRIAMSNNSPKIVSNNREWRSNSAEHTREVLSARARARSEDPFERVGALASPSTSTSTSACTGTSPKTFSTTSTTTTALNGAVGNGPIFNCASNTERNGVDERTPIDNDQCVSHIGTVPKISDRQQAQINKQHDQVHTHQVISDTSAAHATNGQLNELTECDRDDLLRHNCSDNFNSRSDSGSEKRAQSLPAMGQANGKTDTPIEGNTRSSTPREFRESIIPSEQFAKPVISSVVLPTITVVDYGDVLNGGAHETNGNSDNECGPVEQEVFYDFENESGQETLRSKSVDSGLNITAVDDEDEIDDEVFHEQSSRGKWSPPNVNGSAQHLQRNNHGKLADVPEQEEYESNDDDEETEEDDDDDDDEDDEDDYKEEDADAQQSAIKANQTANTNNLDNELYRRQLQRNTDSRERSPLKSTNTSDSNLSTSFPDSGIGDSQASSTTTIPQHLHGNNSNNKHNNNSTANKSQEQQQQQHSLFERDGNSTDCDDMLLQYDELDYATAAQSADDPLGTLTASDGDDLLRTDERLVCIESISLPDVVVESTTGSSASNSSASSIAAAATGGETIININGATGNSMGNVHFIPIHLEGDHTSGNNGNMQQKRRSIDDSVIGSKNGKQSFTHMNGHQSKPTIEIIEEVEDIVDFGTNKLNGMRTDANNEKLKRELIEQKSRFSVQLEDAQKNVHNLQNKVTEMQAKIQKLEQELSTKTWNVERLQSELNAALKDDECVRKHLKMVENEKTSLRSQYDEHEDEFRKRHAELEEQYEELEQKYQTTQNLARTLHTQLAAAQTEAEEWRRQVEKIREELEDQVCILKNALENSEAERKINQDKWQKEFEMLRTQNRDREESLMTDCEWQLRQMQRQFKDKYDKSEHERHVTLEKVEMLENALAERVQEVEHMRVYQAEVISLRGVVTEQEQSIQSLMEQIETLKSELQAANHNLEQQIEAVKKIKYKCDNALCDKERQMIYRIDEVRNEAAAFWEDKLYTEMTRLKNELESVYVDERREALNKLQTEHIEELRALTTRYTANEEELRTELAELQEKFESKNDEFLELREKSDNALLQTRMHLDRADREYQNAMCREEERREKLEDSLRKEFEIEKEQMEEKFRERLGHVKDEFAREIQITTQELSIEHQKELNKQKAKLQAERDEAMQEIADRHRKKMAAAEDQMKDIELRHQHDLKDLKATYDTEKTALDKRDISNANEIEQLHRKCRCLTNLFEEMRLRYERRDPRPEDLREIAELRSRCESQERDLYLLTDRLRELQMQMSENGDAADVSNQLKKSGNKQVKKPPPKTIPTSCDVIYEENEERDSPPPQPLIAPRGDDDLQQHVDEGDDDDDEEEEEDDDDEEEEEEGEQQVIEAPKTERIELDSKELSKKNIDLINEDDSHMITAV